MSGVGLSEREAEVTLRALRREMAVQLREYEAHTPENRRLLDDEIAVIRTAEDKIEEDL